MKRLIVLTMMLAYLLPMQAQKYFTRDGSITFLSDTPIEEIKATNERATSVFDYESGAIEWAVLINAFKFKKALMEEHFNENYMESSKFPKAKFNGVIADLESVDLSKDGTYETTVSGDLEIRGIKKSINPSIIFTVKNGKVVGTSQVKVLVADYGIEIPKVVRENIAKEVIISITANYSQLK